PLRGALAGPRPAVLVAALVRPFFRAVARQAQYARSVARSFLLCFFLAVPTPGPAGLPVHTHLGGELLTSSAAVLFLRKHELHLPVLLLPPFQQAALAVAVFLLYRFKVEIGVDQFDDGGLGALEPLVEEERAEKGLHGVAGNGGVLPPADVELHHAFDLHVLGEDA